MENSKAKAEGRFRKRRTAQGASVAAGIDFIPPHSIEAEQSTLGAMFISPKAVDEVRVILKSVDFYREAHQNIFVAIEALVEAGQPVDGITVGEYLKGREWLDGVGGMTYLLSLWDVVPSAANAEYYARIVEGHAIKRRVMNSALELLGHVREPDATAEELLEHAESVMFTMDNRDSTGGYTPLRVGMQDVLDAADAAAQNGGAAKLTGVSTTVPPLDFLTGGLKPAELTVLAARPSMGKSGLAVQIGMAHARSTNVPVILFSLEMNRAQIALRAMCMDADVNSRGMVSGQLTREEFGRANNSKKDLWDVPFCIDDSEVINPSTMRSSVRRFVSEYGGVGLIIVDYLQLMEAEVRFDNRVQEVTYLARSLKKLSRQFNCPVLALSQLSRAVEMRQNKRPILSDLRESGGIEQDADNVLFIFRPEYYRRKELNIAADDSVVPEEAEIIIGKQRNGPTGTVKWGFIPVFAKFAPMPRGGGFSPAYSAGTASAGTAGAGTNTSAGGGAGPIGAAAAAAMPGIGFAPSESDNPNSEVWDD